MGGKGSGKPAGYGRNKLQQSGSDVKIAKDGNEIIKGIEKQVSSDVKKMSDSALKDRLTQIESNLKAIDGVSSYPVMNKVGVWQSDSQAKKEQLIQYNIILKELKKRNK